MLLVFTAMIVNAGVDWDKVNGDCYSIKEVKLPENRKVQITLTSNELNKFNLKKAVKDPMTANSAVTISKRNGKTVAVFTI